MVIACKTMLGIDSELVGQRFPSQRIGFHHAGWSQPFGMTYGIFEVFAGPVSGAGGDDGHRVFQKGGSGYGLYVKQGRASECGRPSLTAGFRVL